MNQSRLLFILFFFLLGISSCRIQNSVINYNSYDLKNQNIKSPGPKGPEIPGPLAFESYSFSVALGESRSLNFMGGVPPYRFSVLSGSGTIDSFGIFTAPNRTGLSVIRAYDSNANYLDTTVVSKTATPLAAVGLRIEDNQNFYGISWGDQIRFYPRKNLFDGNVTYSISYPIAFIDSFTGLLTISSLQSSTTSFSVSAIDSIGNSDGFYIPVGNNYWEEQSWSGDNNLGYRCNLGSFVTDITTLQKEAAVVIAGDAPTYSFQGLQPGGRQFTTSISRRFANGQNQIDYYQLVANHNSSATESAFDSNSNIYTVGYALDGNDISHWIVRKRLATGTSWSTVDNFQCTPGYSARANGILVTPGNNVLYVVGECKGSLGLATWVVRKSTDLGATWSTVDNYSVSNNSVSANSIISMDSNLYVSGNQRSPTGESSAIIRKYSTATALWSTVNSLTGVLVNRIKSDALGNLYWVGSNLSGLKSAVVRKSTNGGVSWNVIDDFNFVGAVSTSANAFAETKMGISFWVGNYLDSSGINHWVARKSTDGGMTWKTVDDYQHLSGHPSIGYDVCMNWDTQIMSVGFAEGSSSGTNYSIGMNRVYY